MNLSNWEATIQQIVTESNQQAKEHGKHNVLKVWRAKLEKEPSSLLPFQIDQIVREVRHRMLEVST